MRSFMALGLMSVTLFCVAGCGAEPLFAKLGKEKTQLLAQLEAAQKEFLSSKNPKHKEEIARFEKEIQELDAKIEKLPKAERDQYSAKYKEHLAAEARIKEHNEKISSPAISAEGDRLGKEQVRLLKEMLTENEKWKLHKGKEAAENLTKLAKLLDENHKELRKLPATEQMAVHEKYKKETEELSAKIAK